MHAVRRDFVARCCVVSGVLAALLSGSARGADADSPASTPNIGSQPAGQLRTPGQRFGSLAATEEPSFRKHVVPLFARLGCSGRECHGSFQGRGGFQLSLFGSEWDDDFLQLTEKKGDEGRTHIDLAKPEESLIILKPTLQMDHEGKQRYQKDSWHYNLILRWIQAGAKNDADQTGELARLEVLPAEMVFDRPGATVQLRVLAHWPDGSMEDVTELTRFRTNDESVAAVSEAGLVRCVGKGDTHIVASYDSSVVPVPAMLAVSPLAGEHYPAVLAHGKVDELVLNKLRKMGIVPAELCGDAEFLRRVSLDLTGTLPSPDDVVRFLADASPYKRAAKIDELLGTPAYAAWWTTRFCDYTGATSRNLNLGPVPQYYQEACRQQWYQWLYRRIADNVPYDQIAAGIVMGTGRSSPDQSYSDFVREWDSYFRGDKPANFGDHPTLPFYWQRRSVSQPDEKMLSFAHTFLGVRLECAQCHKHPFDRWTKNDFKQFAAIFKSIQINNNPGPQGKEEINQGSVLKELRAHVEEEFQEVTGFTQKELESQVNRQDQKSVSEYFQKLNLLGQMTDIATARRIDAGELVGWGDVWCDSKNMRVEGQQGPNPKLKAKLLGGEVVAPPEGTDARQTLTDWMLGKANPYFAKAIVNRVWATYFHRGIVDPPDDLNIANAPSNGELLDYLAQAFAEHGYNLKWLHREIVSSDTYQRSWRTNESNALDTRNFSHAAFRQLPAEVMYDAIDMALANSDKLAKFATHTESRAIGPLIGENRFRKPGTNSQVNLNPDERYMLNLFGKPARAVNCDCERSTSATLVQTLFTRNDERLLEKIDGKGNRDVTASSWIAELRTRAPQDMDVDGTIQQVFLRTVSRPPSEQELTLARADVAAAKTLPDGIRDLLWALINTREFKVNH